MKKYFNINKFIFTSILVIFSFVQYNNSFGSNIIDSENELIFFNIKDSFGHNLSDKKINKSRSLIINQSPIANAGPDQGRTLTYPDTTMVITLDGSASSDPDGTITSYVWKELGAQIAEGINPIVTMGAGIHIITLTVTDDNGAVDSDIVLVAINRRPVADAGVDQEHVLVAPNTNISVALDASGSFDPDSIIESYVWRKSGVIIAQGINPTVVLGGGIHTITLTVTDDDNLDATDEVIITINSIPNQIPIANAGFDKSVIMNYPDISTPVILDGSASIDPDGSIVSYVWTKDGVEIATGEIASVMLEVGVHWVTLTITDNYGITDTDNILIVLYYKPVAKAGFDQEHTLVYPNTNISVTLNGSSSFDPDGAIKNYIWKESDVEIAQGVKPTIILEEGIHNINLYVTDDDNLESSDEVIITINKSIEPISYYTVSGVVINSDHSGISGVHIINDIYTDGEGRYSFSTPEGTTVIVTPEKEGFTFIPAQRTYNLESESAQTEYIDQNYNSI